MEENINSNEEKFSNVYRSFRIENNQIISNSSEGQKVFFLEYKHNFVSDNDFDLKNHFFTTPNKLK